MYRITTSNADAETLVICACSGPGSGTGASRAFLRSLIQIHELGKQHHVQIPKPTEAEAGIVPHCLCTS